MSIERRGFVLTVVSGLCSLLGLHKSKAKDESLLVGPDPSPVATTNIRPITAVHDLGECTLALTFSSNTPGALAVIPITIRLSRAQIVSAQANVQDKHNYVGGFTAASLVGLIHPDESGPWPKFDIRKMHCCGVVRSTVPQEPVSQVYRVDSLHFGEYGPLRFVSLTGILNTHPVKGSPDRDV